MILGLGSVTSNVYLPMYLQLAIELVEHVPCTTAMPGHSNSLPFGMSTCVVMPVLGISRCGLLAWLMKKDNL